MNRHNEVIKLLFCGNIDDGKSTLLGRLLFDSQAVQTDILKDFLERTGDFKNHSSGDIQYSHLVDGLVEESTRGITIDVGYRYFSSAVRKYIIADTPGHIQYMRNFATAATQSDLAVVLTDASRGITEQTIRHSFLCHLFGIKKFVLAVNKMDLVDYSEDVFEKIKSIYCERCTFLKDSEIEFIPLSAVSGENITEKSSEMQWYKGPVFLTLLDEIKIETHAPRGRTVLIQTSLLESSKGRTYFGTFAGPRLASGESLFHPQTQEIIKIDNLRLRGQPVEEVTVSGEISFSCKASVGLLRGDVLLAEGKQQAVLATGLTAKVFWESQTELQKGEELFVQIGSQRVTAQVQSFITEMPHIAEVKLVFLQTPMAALFAEDRSLGSVMLISPKSYQTLGFGTAVEVSANELDFSKQPPKVLWIMGLASSGKSTLAVEMKKQIENLNYTTIVLDADRLRQGLNSDLGFSDIDKVENIRRLAEMANLLREQGLYVIVCAITPLAESQNQARSIIGDENYFEIFLNTPVEECIKRDAKGLYKRAQQSSINNLPGINGRFDRPVNSHIDIDNTELTSQQVSELIIKRMF